VIKFHATNITKHLQIINQCAFIMTFKWVYWCGTANI